MTRTYLVRGMLAGLLAGMGAFVFARVVVEPQIGAAERFERQLAVQLHQPIEKAVVSRDVQDTIGLGSGVALTGAALGGLFGLTFAGLYRRVGTASVRATSAGLALAGYIAVFLIPFLKYPANPPSVGNPDTIGRRTALYLLCVGIGVLAVTLGAIVRSRSAPRTGSWNAALLGVGSTIAVVIVAYVVMPGVDEVPARFPASVLWQFRLGSAGTSALLWAALGLLFAALVTRDRGAGPTTQLAAGQRRRAG